MTVKEIYVDMDRCLFSNKNILTTDSLNGCFSICIYRKKLIHSEGLLLHFPSTFINNLDLYLTEEKRKFSKLKKIKAILVLEKEMISIYPDIIKKIEKVFGEINIEIKYYGKSLQGKIIFNPNKNYWKNDELGKITF